MTTDNSTNRALAVAERVQQLETEVRRSEKLALIGRLTASVMHEINNPAEATINLVYLISQSVDSPELIAALSRQADEQVRRILYITRQTLSFFKEHPTRQETDLVALIETALRFHKTSLAEKRIVVDRQLPPSLTVEVFPGDFLQLISNLLQNAIRALSPAGTLSLRLRKVSSQVRLTIADNGSGIPQRLRSHLFEPFNTSDVQIGNGLGLWICKSVVERHGGRIRWKSCTETRTHGTTFSISIAS